MKPRLQPTQISLLDLPADGKTFHFDRETAELNPVLQSLLDSETDYAADFTLRPLGNAYELSGTLATELKIPCSLCGIDLKHPVRERLYEILVLGEALPRDGHEAKVNHVTELADQASAMVLEDEVFNLAEYIREILVLASPTRLTKGEDCDLGICPEVQQLLKNGALLLDDPQTTGAAKHRPFGVLQNLKLKS